MIERLGTCTQQLVHALCQVVVGCHTAKPNARYAGAAGEWEALAPAYDDGTLQACAFVSEHEYSGRVSAEVSAHICAARVKPGRTGDRRDSAADAS